MEILDMTFAHVAVWKLVLIVGVVCGVGAIWREAVAHRREMKRFATSRERFNAEHRWEPKIVGKQDYGEWVRKDGKPIGSDE